MALDIFADYERTENNTVFYRLTSDSLTFTLRLSDQSQEDGITGSLYYATSSLNGAPHEKFDVNNKDLFVGKFKFNKAIGTQTITVNVSSRDQNVALNSFTLSAVLLDKYPQASFIAFSNLYIEEEFGYTVPLNTSNYTLASGVYFYGEGHTDTITLSTHLRNNEQATWILGVPPSYFYSSKQTTDNNIKIFNNPTISQTTSASVSSSSGIQQILPISVFITNSQILTSGPIIYYDARGQALYYPFFESSIEAYDFTNSSATNEQLATNNTTFKNSLSVKTYPSAFRSTLVSPFSTLSATLPLDYSDQTYIVSVSTPKPPVFLYLDNLKTAWELSLKTETNSNWNIMTSSMTGISAYQFQLGYDSSFTEGFLTLFKSSPTIPSTLTVQTTCENTIVIDLAPYDWIPASINQVLSLNETINPLPFVNIYTPNYYILKNTEVPLYITNDIPYPYNLKNLEIKSNKFASTFVLSGESLSGSMVCPNIGVADLLAILTIQNTETTNVETVSAFFPGMFEVVNFYDEVDETFYRTVNTQLDFVRDRVPLLSPNEWAVEDNVNSLITKLYDIIESLISKTRVYESKNKFYGWFGSQRQQTFILDDDVVIHKYTWSDLLCTKDGESDEEVNAKTWQSFFCESDINPYSIWNFHVCDDGGESVTFSSCLQKYCFSWKWDDLTTTKNNNTITWKKTKKGENFQKKWIFEECPLLKESTTCLETNWNISTIDPEMFPIVSCEKNNGCPTIGIEAHGNNQIVLAYKKELQLRLADYENTQVGGLSLMDELYAFQNITAIDTSPAGKLLVLDKDLIRVSVFDIIDNSFRLFSSWGSFGQKSDTQGFYQPNDIHVDQRGIVWISDTGNKCVKKLTMSGKGLAIIDRPEFQSTPPQSVCIDSVLNAHVLIEGKVLVFDKDNRFTFQYILPEEIKNVCKINTSYNREAIYITYEKGVAKYFRDGTFAELVFHEYECKGKTILTGYNSISQDVFRNLYIGVQDKVLKVPDLMHKINLKANIPEDLYWKLKDVLVHKEEYIQPWVYLKSFHRLWDNIELLRNSLFYKDSGCKSYVAPYYKKEDITVGQNEIVVNSVVNRLSKQLWTNLQSLVDYFDPKCSMHKEIALLPTTRT